MKGIDNAVISAVGLAFLSVTSCLVLTALVYQLNDYFLFAEERKKRKVAASISRKGAARQNLQQRPGQYRLENLRVSVGETRLVLLHVGFGLLASIACAMTSFRGYYVSAVYPWDLLLQNWALVVIVELVLPLVVLRPLLSVSGK
jgi:hypothetical protein